MKDKEKIKMLQDILNSDAVLKADKPEGVLKVAAAGSSPEEAKDKIMQGLKKVHLPDEEEMGEMMPKHEMSDDEEESEYPDESCMAEEEPEFEKEDSEILDMLPAGAKAAFKQKLLEKIKKM